MKTHQKHVRTVPYRTPAKVKIFFENSKMLGQTVEFHFDFHLVKGHDDRAIAGVLYLEITSVLNLQVSCLKVAYHS